MGAEEAAANRHDIIGSRRGGRPLRSCTDHATGLAIAEVGRVVRMHRSTSAGMVKPLQEDRTCTDPGDTLRTDLHRINGTAALEIKAGDRTRAGDIQPGKLLD